jgi:hypothetical protein
MKNLTYSKKDAGKLAAILTTIIEKLRSAGIRDENLIQGGIYVAELEMMPSDLAALTVMRNEMERLARTNQPMSESNN